MIETQVKRSRLGLLAQVLACVLQLLSVALTVASLEASEWSTFHNDGKEYTFSLQKCVTCPREFDSYSPGCFGKLSCTIGSDACDSGTSLESAGKMYHFSAIVSIMLGVMMLERLVYQLFRKDYGHPIMLYICAALSPLSLLIAVASWFAYTHAKFGEICDDGSCITALYGAQVAITALAFGFLALPLILLVTIYRDKSLDVGIKPIGTGTIVGISYRQWLLAKITPVLMLGLAFNGVSWALPWIRYETMDSHKGNLYGVDRYLTGTDVFYNCIAGPACSSIRNRPLDRRNCAAFSKVVRGSDAYRGLEYSVLLLTILWIEAIVYFAMKREFGIPFLNYVWPLLATVLHISGVMAWFFISGSSFGADCTVHSGDEDINFCAEEGSSFAMWQMICYFFGSIFYVLIYHRRRDGVEAGEEVVGTTGAKKLQDMDFYDEKRRPKDPDSDQNETLNESKGEPFMTKLSKVLTLSRPTTTETDLPQARTLETVESKVVCAYCDEEYSSHRTEKPKAVKASCGHTFHGACMEQVKREKNKCPECRVPIVVQGW